MMQNCYQSVRLPRFFFFNCSSDCLSVSFFLHAGNMSEAGVVKTIYVSLLASAFICFIIQGKAFTGMGDAVMIFSFQLQKTGWCKSVKYFHSRVALC